MLKSLALSQRLPIHVDIGINYGAGPVMVSTVLAILKELSRIESLRMAVPDASLMCKLTEHMPDSGSASIMTKLHLSIFNKLHVAILAPDFFGGRFRTMHTLQLDNCVPTWNSSIPHNLTTMDITLPTFTSGIVTHKAHIDTMLKLLSETSALERLTLVNCLVSIYQEEWWSEDDPSRGGPSWPTIHLPALTHITVDEEIFSTCGFLRHLRLPMVSDLRITCTVDVEDVSGIPSLFGAIHIALPVQFGKATERLELDGIGTSSMRVAGYCHDDNVSIDASPTFTLRLSWGTWSDSRVPEFLAALSDAGFLESIRFIDISMLQPLRRREWATLLDALPAVESMYLRGHALRGLQAALTADHPDGNSMPSADIIALLLPKWRSLHVERCELHCGGEFIDLLQQRCNAKQGLQR